MHSTAATLQDLKAIEEVCLKQDKVMIQHTDTLLTEANWHCKCLHQVLRCIGFNKQALALAQHCMLSWIMQHPQAKKLSRRKMLERAKQIPQWCLQPTQGQSQKRQETKPEQQHRAELPEYNRMTVSNSSVTTFSFLQSIIDLYLYQRKAHCAQFAYGK